MRKKNKIYSVLTLLLTTALCFSTTYFGIARYFSFVGGTGLDGCRSLPYRSRKLKQQKILCPRPKLNLPLPHCP